MGSKKRTSVHCVWALACSMSSTDQRKNNISLFNVIDELTIPSLAFGEGARPIPLEHEIVSHWRRVLDTRVDDREMLIDVAFELVDPGEVVVQRLIAQLVFPPGKRRMRLCVGSNAFFITNPGDYTYRISCKSIDEEEFNKVYEIPFEVKKST